jgi:hypothetical protein
MKAITLIMCAVAINSAAVAQQLVQPTTLRATSIKQPAEQTQMKEGVIKKEGKMWYITSFPDSMLLDNEIRVYANGNYKATNGKIYKLKDGGRLDYEGALEDMDQRIDEKSGMVVMNNGIMWVWGLLNKPMRLTNGDYIMPDGTLRVNSTHKYIPVADNTFIDFNGNLSSQQW